MSVSTNVPSVQFNTTGVVLPAEADILSGVQADINSAFGGGVNPALNTPQGQLAQSFAAIIGDKNNQIAEIANQVNPDYADGRWQDAIGRIYFLDRNPAQPTVLQVTCVGLSGTVIPVGATVSDANGNLYACTTAGTIPAGGSITLQFSALVAGPTPVPATVSIYQAISGWDTATVVSGVVGNNVESRSDFEYRRQNSVALNGRGSLPSIYAAVFDVSGVLDVYVAENTTSAPITLGSSNYTLAPHSIYVAAVGGASADIAQAIWLKKDVGADYNGNTSVTVTDTSGYNIPYPTYTVKYQIAAPLPILFAVQIANNANLPADIVTQVQNAIISAFAGGDGGPRARIGSTIFASRFYSPVAALGVNVSILSILIGTTAANQTSVQVGIDQVPTVTAANISVTLV
ncbi:baseplate J/gp47 family protein [Burkholderia multivorans]|uniref:baseplate J/gp47 family protein n=1 Tax=Burkholderia multivorans TaxID=87883 RepID=UPI000665CCCF|nr:baseplate J/gp47 family protein [Burkholderia multivorans]